MSPVNTKKVEPLFPGCKIGLLAPSGPSSEERFRLGQRFLEQQGYQTVSLFEPWANYGNHAGFASASPAERARALNELFRDPEVKAIIAVRGTYGAGDLLQLIDFASLPPKFFIGCSDVTVLLLQYAVKTGGPAIHGPTLASSFADAATDKDAFDTVRCLLQLCSDSKFRLSEKVQMLRAGRAEGPIIAGNLTMLESLLGTPYDVDYSGSVLVLEEVNEAPYRVHRSLRHLALAGKFDKLAGVVFGRFAKCESKSGPTIQDVLETSVQDFFSQYEYPLAWGLEVGHWGKNLPLPLGCRAEVANGFFKILETPLIER